MAKTEQAIVTEIRCGSLMPVPLAALALVLQGTFAVVDANGFAVASAEVGGADQSCVGIWDHSAENTGADGDVVACVRRKQQFLVRNSAVDPVTQADLGAAVFIEDNQRLRKQMVLVLAHLAVILWALTCNTLIVFGWRLNNDF